MKLKNRSLKSQIWFYLAIFSTLLILLLWLLQVMFFDKYYESRTSSELSKLALKTKYYYKNSKDTSSYDKLSYNNNACIEIIKDNKYIIENQEKTKVIYETLLEKKDFVEKDIKELVKALEYQINRSEYKTKIGDILSGK